MMFAVIVACEVLFWVLILAGLAARYLGNRRTLGTVLLFGAPAVDLILLVVATLDLRGGGQATMAHALAAVYIGISVGFGHQMIKWADVRFAHRFSGGPAPVPAPRRGRAHAARERAGWYRHLAAWSVGCALLLAAVAYIDSPDRTAVFLQVAGVWCVVLAIDFLISFSYTLMPRAAKAA
jgi:hypothetical protein